jgi:23S rRNA pseudouridine1911/1915/1917 synthase
MMSHFTLFWSVEKEHDGLLVRDYLMKVKSVSRSSLNAIKFEGGRIEVNGEEVSVRYKLSEHDAIKVLFPIEKRSEKLKGERIPLSIVYEDEHIIVVNKPFGMASMPSPNHTSGTLSHALLHYYDQNKWPYTIHIVNRLDRDTSGLMLVAKHRYAHHLFSTEQKVGNIERKYLAIVHGKMDQEHGVIDEPIGRKDESIIEREVRHDGQRAVTYYHVVETFANYSLVQLKLETGRTHQIRVHMSFMNHPLVGDDLYGGETAQLSRQALHSAEISFFHPILNQTLHFKSNLPNDIMGFLNKKSSEA